MARGPDAILRWVPRRGKGVPPMPSGGFWRDKEACWEMLGCTREIYSQCIAYREPETPCWEHVETQCKRVLGFPVECDECKVFKLYGGWVKR